MAGFPQHEHFTPGVRLVWPAAAKRLAASTGERRGERSCRLLALALSRFMTSLSYSSDDRIRVCASMYSSSLPTVAAAALSLRVIVMLQDRGWLLVHC